MTKSKLYTPLKIGSMEVKNRVMMAPISTGFEPADGSLSEPIINYWVERAKGGVGLIIIGAVTIDSEVPYQTPQTISLGEDKFIPGFKELTDRCHAYGAKVMPQIAYMGAESCNPWFKGIEAVGPSSYVNAQGFQCREMRLDEIPPIIKKYGETALRAKKAGCDGVQVHCACVYDARCLPLPSAKQANRQIRRQLRQSSETCFRGHSRNSLCRR